eukprot:TRINITY_DN40479_c0_g1_i1.p1 TRINITY_DN40479_c0_g1~~TRINITY_DN40479_c0_g1_i1.p1  ORF type:complete len:281 (+),score=90.19 TRINITY_DN40479_c0_g1_i1:59-844(+)
MRCTRTLFRTVRHPSLLCVNPNTSADFTGKLKTALRDHPCAAVTCVQPSAGPASIEGVFDEALSLQPSLEKVLSLRGTFDGVVVACFSDHALVPALREVLREPVVGILQSSCHTAAMLGHKFSIVTTNARWRPLLEHAVASLFPAKLASVRTTDMPVLALEGAGAGDVVQRVVEQSVACVQEDGAEVIVLGCAGMAGLQDRVRAAVGPGIPVVDPVVSGVEICASLVRQQLFTSQHCLYERPQRKPLAGAPNAVLEGVYSD